MRENDQLSGTWNGVPTLLIEKFSRRETRVSATETAFTVTADGPDLLLTLDSDEFRLSRGDAIALRETLGEALCQRREFFRTAGEHREDGSYVVSRRGATSAGHSKVFQTFQELERLYKRLPAEFTAEDVGRTGLTAGRRHMLVRHFAEHPAFDCDLVRRQPLTVRKQRVTKEEPMPAG